MHRPPRLVCPSLALMVNSRVSNGLDACLSYPHRAAGFDSTGPNILLWAFPPDGVSYPSSGLRFARRNVHSGLSWLVRALALTIHLLSGGMSVQRYCPRRPASFRAFIAYGRGCGPESYNSCQLYVFKCESTNEASFLVSLSPTDDHLVLQAVSASTGFHSVLSS